MGAVPRRIPIAMRTALAVLLAALPFLAGPAGAKDPILVTMDRAKVMRISTPADTVIVGNPGIADAVVHDRQTLIITGRMVGVTNLVILDKKGEPIADETITVEKIQQNLVTVQRGNQRSSYFCTPHCASMMEVGDSPESFGTAQAQISQRNSLGAQFTGGPPGQQ